ncbi:MAG: hypothetical protein V3V41_05425 [Candidatus Heimdallarchaeota archaeon]
MLSYAPESTDQTLVLNLVNLVEDGDWKSVQLARCNLINVPGDEEESQWVIDVIPNKYDLL